MTTMITGAGQIGAHVAQILLADAQEPLLYDIRAPLDFIRAVIPEGTPNVRQGDIRDRDALIDAIRQYCVDRIIHTAAVLPPNTEDDPQLTTAVNIQGTFNLLEAARMTGVKRVVFCSTVGLYDMRAVRGDRVREDDSVKPDSLYGASKLYGELLGQNYARRRGVAFVALRFAHIFGPAPLPIRPGIASFVGDLAKASARGVACTVRARTPVPREYVYIRDAARAAVLAAASASVADGIINIGTGRVHHPDEMARIASAITPGARIDVDYSELASTGASPSRPFDLGRASTQLGYVPAFDLESGIREFIAYQHAHP